MFNRLFRDPRWPVEGVRKEENWAYILTHTFASMHLAVCGPCTLQSMFLHPCCLWSLHLAICVPPSVSISKVSVFNPEKPAKVFSWALCGWHHSDPAVTARMKGLTDSVAGSAAGSAAGSVSSTTASRSSNAMMELDPDACPEAETSGGGLGELVDGMVEDESDGGDRGDSGDRVDRGDRGEVGEVGEVGDAAEGRGAGEVAVMPGRGEGKGGGKGEGKIEGGKGEKRRCKLL